MDQPLVSVIVPTFNRAYCLERSVGSALAQAGARVEVELIDDGSSDGTEALVAARWGGDARVRYHRQANGGISAARNAGLSRARGEYVALLDSDDEWLPGKLALQLACMRAHPSVGLTWTDMLAVDPSGAVFDSAYLRTMYAAYRWFPTPERLFQAWEPLADRAPQAAGELGARRFYWGEIGAQMILGNLVHTSTVVMTRARALLVGRFRRDLRHAGEDYEFFLRACRLGPVGYLDLSTIRYQRGMADRATKPENRAQLARNFLRVIEPILAAERLRPSLPRALTDELLADAHEWLGEALLDAGDLEGARRSLLLSLRRARRPRTFKLLAAALLPPLARYRSRKR